MARENKEFTMDIMEGFDYIIEESGNSSLNLRKVSWNGREPVYDIRTWTLDHTEYGKGVTITQGEMKKLQELIKDMIDDSFLNPCL